MCPCDPSKQAGQSVNTHLSRVKSAFAISLVTQIDRAGTTEFNFQLMHTVGLVLTPADITSTFGTLNLSAIAEAAGKIKSASTKSG